MSDEDRIIYFDIGPASCEVKLLLLCGDIEYITVGERFGRECEESATG